MKLTDSGLFQQRLPGKETEAYGEACVGKFLNDSHYDVLLEDEGALYKPNGELLVALLKRGIGDAAGRAMYRAIRARIAISNNRGKASGLPRTNPVNKATGLPSNTSKAASVESSIMGFFDRYPRMPFCRRTAFNENYPDEFKQCLPALQDASNLFARHAPEAYARQRAMVEQTHPDFVIPGTVFTTVTLNRNFRTAGHRDAGDLPDGFGVMTYYRAGKFTGGRLVFPEYRAAVEMDTFDVILFDPHEVHGNTPIVPGRAGEYERVTCVQYYRKNMFFCGSAAHELELAKKHDARDYPRDLKEKPL